MTITIQTAFVRASIAIGAHRKPRSLPKREK